MDDLDYHLTFPTPPDSGTAGNETESVVVLLGWAGCLDRYLEKYSSIYEGRRCITIRYTAPTDVIFFDASGSKLKHIGIQLLDLLTELNLEENPIFFHVFSNGGCLVYRHIEEALRKEEQFQNLQVKGCIIDSAPAQRRLLRGAKAFMAILNYNVVFKYLLCLLWIIATLLKGLLGAAPMSEFWKSMNEGKCHYPMLFLYSKADDVVYYGDIETVVKHRKENGVDVQSLCWDDSPHVKHLVVHREPYINRCFDFLNYCLN